MKIRNIAIAAICLIICAVSCDRLDVTGMVFPRPGDTEERVTEWLAWDAEHGENLITGVPDDYRFYACSDPHCTDSAPRVATFLQRERNDGKAYFSMIMGDLANESGEDPYRSISQVIDEHELMLAPHATGYDTCFAIAGNHDVYFDCWGFYKQYFHTSTYRVIVRTISGKEDLYLFLDSGNGTHGKKQLDWLKEQLSHREDYRNCFVITHNCIFRTSYNYSTTPAANLPEDEYYALIDLMSKSNVTMFLMGHFHHCEEQTIGGVRYVMTNNLNDEEDPVTYLVVNSGDTVTYYFEEL